MPDKRLLKEGSAYFGSQVKGEAHHGRKVMAQVSAEAVLDAREARKQRAINVYVLNSLSAVFSIQQLQWVLHVLHYRTMAKQRWNP